jgi:outer membrane lipoprotein-sorting protein
MKTGMRFSQLVMLSSLFLSPILVSAAPTVEELLNKTDDLMRGESSRATMRMHVRTGRWERELVMSVLSKGEDRTLVQILSPAKEKGTATLKVEKNIWNYLPKVDRTIKVPASMMSGAWMGSHLTNDDLVKDSRFVNHYDCEYTQLPDEAHLVEGVPGETNPGERGPDETSQHYVISCIPKPDAPVVWGEVILAIRAQDEIIDRVQFFDERKQLVRSIVYTDIIEVGDKKIPRRIRVIPEDKPDEITEIIYEEIEFDVDIPDRTFSLQALRR